MDPNSGWACHDVLVATKVRQRAVGVTRGAERLLLRTRHVHGFGLPTTIKAVAITGGGVVSETILLRPGKLSSLRSAAWVLELPLAHPLPEIGAMLAIYAPASARETHSVRHTHREPR